MRVDLAVTEINEGHLVKVRFQVGVDVGLWPASLNTDAQYAFAKIWLPAEKEFVVISTAISASAEAIEIIKIQLSLKRCHLGLTKVLRL